MNTVAINVRDRLRQVLGIRTPRATPRRGPRPSLGARIFREDVRMTVQAGMSSELWAWLQREGWREITFRPDRRTYREIPSTWVTRLTDCPADERERILAQAIAEARRQGSARG
jgi:hypothetical protein